MSVAHLTTQELACFVAIAHKHLEAGTIAHLCKLAEIASRGNSGAYTAQYGETAEPSSATEIEAVALDYLADRRDMVADHFGPITYNMVTNNGVVYATQYTTTTDRENAVFAAIDKLEKAAHKWQDAEARKLNRDEQNAVGYNDIGQLTTMTSEEIEAIMQARKMGRIITAEFRVDESDSQSDYWSGRCTRTVVIGFGKGRRENFRQLRKVAGDFPPTAHMGPGLGIFTPRVVILEDFKGGGAYYYEGSYSHWHSDLDSNGDLQFSTREEAEAYTREKGEPDKVRFDGSQVVRFGWEINETSYENRECYSMGGGNYLGAGRYSGWQVSSTAGLSTSRKHEVWEGVASQAKATGEEVPEAAAAPIMSIDEPPPGCTTVTENEEKDGVEIRFVDKPAADVRENLKAHGFRWSRFSSCWYKKRSADSLAFALGLIGREVTG